MLNTTPIHEPRIHHMLLVAILIHTIILIILLLRNAHSVDSAPVAASEAPAALELQQPNAGDSPTSTWAARRAANSEFGSPVLFYDDVQAAADQPETIHDPSSHDTSPEQSAPDSQELELSAALATSPDTMLDTPADESPAPEVVPEIPQADTAPAEFTQPRRDDTTIIKPAEQLPTPKTPVRQHQLRKRPAAIRAPKSPQPSAKTLSMAQLTRGFLDYAHQESGNSLIEVIGGHDGPVSSEQLKHERYWQKIFWWINKTSRMNRHRFPEQQRFLSSSWHLYLHRDGSIAQLTLAQPSGMPALDSLVRDIVYEASTSFPPVPNYFEGETYHLSFSMYNNYHQAPRLRLSTH